MEFEAVIGLEVHTELLTKSKMYCGCSTEFGGMANSNVCPVCLGLPGALPMINKKAIEFAMKAGFALNCSINQISRMDRKQYFYPDTPKNYQITQSDVPICHDGYVEIENSNNERRKIRIERIHVEEDAGKNIHGKKGALIDFNRSGVPLIEIVTRPDVRTPEEATLFLQKLKSILESLEVSDCKMEEGSLRCDGNISIRNVGDTGFGVKSEIKNMNSFKALEKALNYEYNRQCEEVKNGNKLFVETRRWDEEKNKTVVMRNKEEANDYRYFPEGDLVVINISDEWLNEVKNSIGELPHEKVERFIKEYNIPKYDAEVLNLTKDMSVYFENTAKLSNDAKSASNWLMGDISRLMNEDRIWIKDLKFDEEKLSELIKLINSNKISNNIGKKVLEEMFKTGDAPSKIVESKGLVQNSNEGEILEIVNSVLDKNEKSIEDFKNGKDRVVGFLVGQVMKESKGKANPQIVNKLVLDEIKKR